MVAKLSTIVPYTGWILLLVVLIWITKQYFGRFFQELGARSAPFFLKLFRRSLLNRRAVRRYRRAIQEQYSRHALGFRRDGAVNVSEIYVSLQYLDDGHRKSVDRLILSPHRIVALGEPGAGKSLLMKHLLTSWAKWPFATIVPVLVELHRCNSDEDSLTELIAQEFKRRGIESREGAVEAALREGRLLILFDGLDEVARNSQTQVINLIKDFSSEWHQTKIIVTCRAAVYTGQLSPDFAQTVTITDFDDAGIRRLLAKWPGLTSEEADRFFRTLAENPQLMRLAGSPLLLTMMIHLQIEVFTRSGRTLPTSRSAFYDDAVDHLLRRDRDLARHDALSIYDAADKRAALQTVALALQFNAPDQPDRKTIDRMQLLDLMKELGKRLNLRDSDIWPLINEIVERSQLLVDLGGNSARYAFRHLTLQEYLAANELRNDPNELLRGYRADRAGWRETVRLWCGVTSLDCTAVVHELFNGSEEEKILALQCVAEAKNIATEMADDVISHFINGLKTNSSNRAAELALGAVASDERPRGAAVLNQVIELFRAEGESIAPAARVLAATRRTEAAAILGRKIQEHESARSALRTMGEQAIPALRAAAAKGDTRSVDDLGEIATAAAANALVTLIWDDSDVAFRAAWWVASLVRHAEVVDRLADTTPADIEIPPTTDWVWAPFASKVEPATTTIGRVVWLVSNDTGDHAPKSVIIDQRIAIAIVSLNHESDRSTPVMSADALELTRAAVEGLRRDPEIQPHRARLPLPGLLEFASIEKPAIVKRIIDLFLGESDLSGQQKSVFQHSSAPIQYAMIGDALLDKGTRRKLTKKHWTTTTLRGERSDGGEGILIACLVSLFVVGTLLMLYRALSLWGDYPNTGPKIVDVMCFGSLTTLAIGSAVFGLADSRLMGKRPASRLHKSMKWFDQSLFVPVLVLIFLLIDALSLIFFVADLTRWSISIGTATGITAVGIFASIVINRRQESYSSVLLPYLAEYRRNQNYRVDAANPWIDFELTGVEMVSSSGSGSVT
ncbi:NACHT domain-containing protein [Kribbella sp. NBC_00382]|uniref:NACHT domain-containing protein n=1 Tax=Kribbella sp. NBC_00382 TaxID=2975967 RepID=UPI002E1A77E2